MEVWVTKPSSGSLNPNLTCVGEFWRENYRSKVCLDCGLYSSMTHRDTEFPVVRGRHA